MLAADSSSEGRVPVKQLFAATQAAELITALLDRKVSGRHRRIQRQFILHMNTLGDGQTVLRVPLTICFPSGLLCFSNHVLIEKQLQFGNSVTLVLP